MTVATRWERVPLIDAFEDATRGQRKTKQREYLDKGKYPIVDQGQRLVGGYTNDVSMLSNVDLPVILFGDHTKCIKYVDFPFGLGADGVKVLRPREGVDAKFLYHYLRSIPLHDGGYSRHFKYLKEASIPLPPIREQRRVAAVFDEVDALEAHRRRALAKLDNLTQAIFIDEFRDHTLTGTASLSKHVELITKGTTPTSVGYEFTSLGVPFVRVKDMRAGTVVVDDVDLFISKETSLALGRSRLQPGDVLVSIAGTIGRIAVVPDEAPELNCNQAVALVRPAKGLNSVYLAAWLRTDQAQRQMTGSRVTGTISNLSLTSLRNLQVPVPSAADQSRFAATIRRLRGVENRTLRSATVLDRLLRSMQQRAFRGGL